MCLLGLKIKVLAFLSGGFRKKSEDFGSFQWPPAFLGLWPHSVHLAE